jgi:hypothetical protein
MGHPCLKIVGMLATGAESGSGFDADHQGKSGQAARKITQFGSVVDDHVRGQGEKGGEHDFHDRPESGRGRAHGEPGNGCLGNRGVPNALGSEFFQKSMGGEHGIMVDTHTDAFSG